MASLWPRPAITPEQPGPGQESVWDYPRPPAVDSSADRVVVTFAGTVIADTTRALRVLETSHPPVFYLPVADIVPGVLRANGRTSYCEFKGVADYVDLVVGEQVSRDAAWGYATPAPGFEALLDHLAFYPGRVERATVAGEVVQAQEGDFYGGWRTSKVVGPFKGAPGTRGW